MRALVGRDETADGLNNALRLLSKWRSHLIQTVLLKESGTRVLGGIFAGMSFIKQSAEGCHVAKLLGTYEQPLHPYIEDATRSGYDVVINVGCAEGYYAVGLARRIAGAKILAFDINEAARRTCAELAARNGVSDRVIVGEKFNVSDFQKCGGANTLVVCDIEGAERELLDPVAAPSLLEMDLIVEAHDCMSSGLAQLISKRFAATHEVVTVTDCGNRTVPAPPPWFAKLSHLDQLLAVWEWRTGATPWLVMRRHRPS